MSDPGALSLTLAESPDHIETLKEVFRKSDALQDLEDALSEPDVNLDQHDVYLAERNGQAIGCVMATRDDHPIVHALLVVPDCRRQGIAGQILSLVMDDQTARKRPAFIWTAVDPSIPSAQQRFLDLGFSHAHRQVKGLDLMLFDVLGDQPPRLVEA